MNALTVRSWAKINWLLHVLGRRDDGYHDLETVFQSISLHDTLRIEKSREVSMTCDVRYVPTGPSNLVVKAAALMQERFGAGGVRVHLKKRIPVGGGMGGGSSNAAATLLAIRKLYGLAIPPHDLMQAALDLGSDVPFFFTGGTAYATGRGEKLWPLADEPPTPLLLLLPGEHVSTAVAFRALAEGRTIGQVPLRSEPLFGRHAFDRPLLAMRERLANDFEPVIFGLLPRLGELKSMLLAAGATWAAMTGSGSTIVGAFSDEASRDAALARLRASVECVAASTIGRSEALGLTPED